MTLKALIKLYQITLVTYSIHLAEKMVLKNQKFALVSSLTQNRFIFIMLRYEK